jgi:alcohol dehydrogenase (cytochrome c)
MHHRKTIAISIALTATAMLAGCAEPEKKAAATPPMTEPAPVKEMAVPPGGAAAADWTTYHGTWRDYDFSSLDQINADTVAHLDVAWTHDPGRDTRGLQSMPLVQDGVLYYSGSYSRVYALDGATGKVIWSYFPKLDEGLIKRQTHSPYNRGVALGHGHVYVGTMDGRLIALDQKTGKRLWDTKLINSEKLTVGFTGAPMVVKDLVVIGGQGGEWPYRGPIFAVDGATGKKKWTFLTVAPDKAARATWGHHSWRTGGGGGWMPGTYDASTNTLWWGTANPAPLFDWSGADVKSSGARPGDNLYTTSVLALDPDTGKLKFYHQELPHDAWDFDSAVGEFVMIEHDGKDLVVHPNKSGYIFVYNRADASLVNVWRITENSNFVQNIDPKTGELIGRRDFSAGDIGSPPLCPAISGGVSLNSGAYDPRTGTYFKVGNEWCMDMKVVKTRPILEPQAQLNIGANFVMRAPPGADKPWGHVDARDPITGEIKWQVKLKEPPLASLLATAGNLLFVPDAEGVLHAYDSRTGKELWSHTDGVGHDGGIMTYSANGKQYVAVVAGWGGMATDDYPKMFGEPFTTMPRNTGVLTVYALK